MTCRPLVILAVLLGGCVVDKPAGFTGPTGQRSPPAGPEIIEARKERGEVMQELDRYYKDFSARNWEAFATHFWPGATITTIWAPPGETQRQVVATAIADFIVSAGEGPDSKPVFEKIGQAEVRAEKGLALAWVTYQASVGEAG